MDWHIRWGLASYTPQGIEEESNIKNQNAKLRISQNPFIQKAVIEVRDVGQGFSLAPPWRSPTIQVYDLMGRLVKSLPIPNPESPVIRVIWDAKGHSAGVYFVKLEAGDYKETAKLLLIK